MDNGTFQEFQEKDRQKNTLIVIFEISIIVWTFTKSIILGFVVTIYVILRRGENRNFRKGVEKLILLTDQEWQKKYDIVKNQLDAIFEDRKDSKQTKKWLENTPKWKLYGYDSEEQYQADRERELRRKEQDYFLAKAYKKRSNKSKFKKNITIVDNLFELTPVEFEKWVKENVFEKEGWVVEETSRTGDGGIDLVLKKRNEYSIAQCKRFKKTVGEPALRDFYGTMISEGVSKGYFITTGLFSLSAQKFANEKPIVLIDRQVLANLINI